MSVTHMKKGDSPVSDLMNFNY